MKQKFIPAWILIVAVTAFGLSGRAEAQFTNPYTGRTWNNPTSSLIDTFIRNDMNRMMLESSLAKKQGKNAAAAAVPEQKRARQPASATDFSPGKGRPAVDQFFANSGLRGEELKGMRQYIDGTFAALESQYRKNSVATAMALALGTSVEIASGQEISDAQARELVANVNDLLASAPSFTKLKASEKQTMYDTFVLVSGLMLALKSSGDTDPTAKQASVEMAKGVLEQLTGAKTGGASVSR